MEELGMDPDEITDEDCSSLRWTRYLLKMYSDLGEPDILYIQSVSKKTLFNEIGTQGA